MEEKDRKKEGKKRGSEGEKKGGWGEKREGGEKNTSRTFDNRRLFKCSPLGYDIVLLNDASEEY